MEKRKIAIIGLGVLLVISIVVLVISIVNKPKEEYNNLDGIEVPKNEEVLKDKTIGDIKISNVSLVTMEGISTFSARVYNNLKTDLSVKKLTAVFHVGDEKISIEVLNDVKIAPEDYTMVSISSKKDLSKTKKIEYVLE